MLIGWRNSIFISQFCGYSDGWQSGRKISATSCSIQFSWFQSALLEGGGGGAGKRSLQECFSNDVMITAFVAFCFTLVYCLMCIRNLFRCLCLQHLASMLIWPAFFTSSGCRNLAFWLYNDYRLVRQHCIEIVIWVWVWFFFFSFFLLQFFKWSYC